MSEKEWQTRKRRIDPRLNALGWVRKDPDPPFTGACRYEEFPTDNGPADYALSVGGKVVGIVEAKKLIVGPHPLITMTKLLF